MVPVSYYSSNASLQFKPPTPLPVRQAAEAGRARTQSDPRHGQHAVNSVSGTYHYREHIYLSKNGSDASLQSLPLKFKPNVSKLIKEASDAVPFSIDGVIGVGTPTRRRHLSSTTEVDETAKEPAGAAHDPTSVSKIAPDDRIALRKKIDEIFSELPSADVDQMRRQRDEVYEKLLNMKIDHAELQAILRKIEKADLKTALRMGAASSIGFIGGAHAWNLLAPMLTAVLPPVILPILPGAITGIVDRMASWILSRLHSGYYCTPLAPEELTDVMRDCFIQHQRPLMKELARQSGALSVPYTIRNVIIVLCATIAARYGQQNLAKTLVNNFGGIFAGAAVQYLRNENDKRDGLNHPAYFFGRIDLEERLEMLRHPQPMSLKGLVNLAYKGIRKLPATIFDAVRHILALQSMTEIAFLAGGFAVNDSIENAVTTYFSDASPEALEFAKCAASTTYLLALYASLVDVMTLADCLKHKLMTCQPFPESTAVSPSEDFEHAGNQQRH